MGVGNKMGRDELTEELRKMFDVINAFEFPGIYASNEDLARIRVRLSDQENYIIGLVDSYLRGASINEYQVIIDEQLNKSVADFKPSNDKERKTITEIRKYLTVLDELTKLLKKTLDSN